MYNTTIEEIYNSRDLLTTLQAVSTGQNKTISIIPFGSTYNMFDRMTEKVKANRVVTKIKEKKGTALFKLETFDRHSGTLRSEGKFILYKDPQYQFIHLFITIEESDFFHREFRPFIKKTFYQEVILSFIKSHDLIRLIENYQQASFTTEIKITRASQKIRYYENDAMSTVTWNNSSLEKAYENNGFFKSVQFKAMRNDQEISNIFFDRRGIVRIERDFQNVFDSLVKPTITLLEHYIILFNKRARRDNSTLNVSPLEILYVEPLFSNIDNHKNFIHIISTLENTSVSVLHGNPYIHLTIIDYVDGSSYDLWVVNPNKLVIVPQLRSSIIGLKRIVNHIFDTYAEGEIRGYEN
jgi:hypothetical protein